VVRATLADQTGQGHVAKSKARMVPDRSTETGKPFSEVMKG